MLCKISELTKFCEKEQNDNFRPQFCYEILYHLHIYTYILYMLCYNNSAYHCWVQNNINKYLHFNIIDCHLIYFVKVVVYNLRFQNNKRNPLTLRV